MAMQQEAMFKGPGREARVMRNRKGRHCVVLTGQGIKSIAKMERPAQIHGCFGDRKSADAKASKLVRGR